MSQHTKRRRARQQKKGKTAALNLVSLMDIFTILVFFLLVNSSDGEVLPSHKSVKLPESVSEEKPRETVVVMITDQNILVQGKVIAAVDTVLKDKGDYLAVLQQALEEQNSRAIRKRENGEAIRREATIMGDKAIPYRLLKKVMATCTQAGFGRVSLAVLQKPLEEG